MKLPLPPARSASSVVHQHYAEEVATKLSLEIERLDTPGINLSFLWTVDDDEVAGMRVDVLRCLACMELHVTCVLLSEHNEVIESWELERP